MNGTPIITESDSPTQISISKETQTTEEEDTWGIGLTANHISHNGLTLVFTQSDGEPTGELQTGSPFWLEKFADGQWEAVETVIPANEIAVSYTHLFKQREASLIHHFLRSRFC